MVDVTVFEQAPELQAGQQEGVFWGVGMAESAVETIDRLQLCDLLQHHRLHLLHMSHSIRAGTVAESKDVGKRSYVQFYNVKRDLTCLRSASRCLWGILSRRHSIFRPMSSPKVDESLPDGGDAPLTRYKIVSHRIGDFQM